MRINFNAMRILIVTTFFPPLNSIASLRPYSWAKYWTEEGHQVTVLTTQKEQDPAIHLKLPNNGFEVIAIPYPSFFSSLKKDYHTSNTLTTKHSILSWPKKALIAFFHYLRNKKGIFNSCRMPDFTEFWRHSALKAIQSREWDLVVSTSGPYTVHVLAEKLKKKKRTKKWIADFRDTWSDDHLFPGIFPLNLWERRWERKLMRSADAITTVSNPFVELFASKYGSHKVHLLENGFDPEDLKNLSEAPFFSEDGKFRIVHTGFIYQGKRDPTPLFQAIKEMKEEGSSSLLDKLEVIFVGPQQALLQGMLRDYGITKWVKSSGMVSRETALQMQRDAHALLFLPWSDISIDGVLTGKIFEYLYSGTPIIAVGGKGMEASQRLLLEAKAGQVLASVEQIKGYLKTKLVSIKKEKSQPDETVLARYDRKILANKLLKIANP